MATIDADPTLFDAQYFGPDASQDPYVLCDYLRGRQPVSWSQRMEAWALFRYEDVRDAYRSRSIGQGDRTWGYVRKMSEADQGELHPLCPYMSRFISFLDPPEHRRQRDLVGKVFRPRTVEAMRSTIQERVDQLLDEAAAAGGMDALEDFALPLTSSTLCALVGVTPELRPEFIEQVLIIFTFLGSDHTDPLLAHKAKDAYAWITAEIMARLRGPASDDEDDLVSQLGHLVRDGAAAEEDACGILVGLVQGGFETTSSLISNAIYTLLLHPDELRRVRDDMELLPAAIVEVVRYESSLKYVIRQAYEDIDIGGRAIRTGEQLMLMLGAANRDPAAFELPNVFDVGRDARTNVAFGLGLHFCLGAPLAKLQTELAVGAVITRFASLQLEQPADSYRWKESALLRQLTALRVRV